jgi:hypothetical protein
MHSAVIGSRAWAKDQAVGTAPRAGKDQRGWLLEAGRPRVIGEGFVPRSRVSEGKLRFARAQALQG